MWKPGMAVLGRLAAELLPLLWRPHLDGDLGLDMRNVVLLLLLLLLLLMLMEVCGAVQCHVKALAQPTGQLATPASVQLARGRPRPSKAAVAHSALLVTAASAGQHALTCSRQSRASAASAVSSDSRIIEPLLSSTFASRVL
jgi:hypothetical protein